MSEGGYGKNTDDCLAEFPHIPIQLALLNYYLFRMGLSRTTHVPKTYIVRRQGAVSSTSNTPREDCFGQ